MGRPGFQLPLLPMALAASSRRCVAPPRQFAAHDHVTHEGPCSCPPLPPPSAPRSLCARLMLPLSGRSTFGFETLVGLGGFKNLRGEFEWEGHVLELDKTDFDHGTLYEIEVETVSVARLPPPRPVAFHLLDGWPLLPVRQEDGGDCHGRGDRHDLHSRDGYPWASMCQGEGCLPGHSLAGLGGCHLPPFSVPVCLKDGDSGGGAQAEPEVLRPKLEAFLADKGISFAYSTTSKFANFRNKTLD